MIKQQRSTIVNLKQFDIVLTTSFEFKHGISGHTFEMIEYFYAIQKYTDLKPCILLSDGTTTDEFMQCLSKYKFDPIMDIFEAFQPKVIMTNNILIVDGSHRMKNCDIFSKNIFLFRCSEDDFSFFYQRNSEVFLLQDYDVYDEKIGIDYKKKILFDEFVDISEEPDEVAMMYLTTNCRALTPEDANMVITKYGYTNNLILTNDSEYYSDVNATVLQVPVSDMWNKFSAYIYTNVPRQLDCSPRFIAECRYYGKEIIYDINYLDKGVEVRKNDSLEDITLTKDDYFLELLREQIKPIRNCT